MGFLEDYLGFAAAHMAADQAVNSYTKHIDSLDFVYQARTLKNEKRLFHNFKNDDESISTNEKDVVYLALYGFLKNIKVFQCRWSVLTSWFHGGKRCKLLVKTAADIKKLIETNLRIAEKTPKIQKHFALLEEKGLRINAENVANFLIDFQPNVINEVRVIARGGGGGGGRGAKKTKKKKKNKRHVSTRRAMIIARNTKKNIMWRA